MNICYQDFPNICRICLISENLHRFVQPKQLNLFKFLANIQVTENDVLPKNICSLCLNKLEEILLFIENCKRNDTLLREISVKQPEHECDNRNDSGNSDYESTQPAKFEPSKDLKNSTSSKLIKSYKIKTICSICGVTVSQSGQKNHYIINPKCRPKDCMCPVCEKSFYPKYKLTIHLKSHKKNTPFECPGCLKKFAFAENLRKHALTHKGVKPFICKVCDRGFLRKRSLDEHMNFHTGETPYVCAYCGESFKRLSDHAAHVYHMHDMNVDKIPKHRRKYTEKRVHLNIECKACGKMFASRSGFANHQLIHTGVKKFLCNVCGRKFITNPTLQSHMRTHTGEKPFECSECGKTFRQRNSLTIHTSRHTSDKSLPCPNCERRYKTRSGLDNHLLTHSESKAFECPECKKSFPLKISLHNHLLNHKDEKPHKCSLCDKTFASMSHLNVHIRKHSGEKPYTCTICGKQLAQPQTLKVHMRQHTGEVPYVCSVCKKGFHDSSNRKRHFNRHHGSSQVISKGVVEADNASESRP